MIGKHQTKQQNSISVSLIVYFINAGVVVSVYINGPKILIIRI